MKTTDRLEALRAEWRAEDLEAAAWVVGGVLVLVVFVVLGVLVR